MNSKGLPLSKGGAGNRLPENKTENDIIQMPPEFSGGIDLEGRIKNGRSFVGSKRIIREYYVKGRSYRKITRLLGRNVGSISREVMQIKIYSSKKQGITEDLVEDGVAENVNLMAKKSIDD